MEIGGLLSVLVQVKRVSEIGLHWLVVVGSRSVSASISLLYSHFSIIIFLMVVLGFEWYACRHT